MAVAVSDLSRDRAAEQTAQEYGEYVRGIDKRSTSAERTR